MMEPNPRESSAKRHLLLVDDDPLFLGVFAANLQAAGYAATCCDRASDALTMLETATVIDGCIVDLDMPGLDGLSFIRTLGERSVRIPLMVVTAHSGPMFEQAALELGVQDFVDKGRGFNILMHRLDRLLSPLAAPPDPAPTTVLANGRLVAAQRQASWAGVEVALTRTELAVVELLVSRAGAHVGYREIYDAIKTNGFVAGAGDQGYRTNVRAAIKRIRRKFTDVDPSFDALENYPGVGYRWHDDG